MKILLEFFYATSSSIAYHRLLRRTLRRFVGAWAFIGAGLK